MPALPSAVPPAKRYTHFWARAFGAGAFFFVVFFARVTGIPHLPDVSVHLRRNDG